VKVHGLLAGTGKRPLSGTAGPTAVTAARPCASLTETVSPSIASHGCAALADATRPTVTFAFGSHDGIPP